MTEWPLHDHLPAGEGWPGGKRYGFKCARQLRPRGWSDKEQARAKRHGIELPEIDYCTFELWWDQEAEEIATFQQAQPITFSMAELDGPISIESPKINYRRARQYGRAWWDFQLDKEIENLTYLSEEDGRVGRE